MTTDGKELDALIREALSREEAALFDRLGPPSLPDLLTETFRGRFRWINLFGGLLSFVFFGLAVSCAVMIFRTDDVPRLFRWGLGFSFSISAVLGLKLWFWMEMQRHATSREVKRVELAVAHLAAELRAGRAPGPDS
ncbi:DUF6768 family protein [Tautonia plasticadhaerens]|uniref:Uncharacterized protein n=1 Tax=Tautonia plasticadhaerens TaxID=2527974 RepID=A0A518HD70_9BACT|nr:DUF6768 family protein [Tautonia plasticadhaerens]QDV38808.1 hypothetical protein ElP_67650 [Tautonia plasticadhaerens]